MILYIGITILVLFLAFLVKNQSYVSLVEREAIRNKSMRKDRQQLSNLWICVAIFTILAAVSACRIAVGNDYWVYREMFRLIAQNRHVSSEIGFNFVVRVFQSIFGWEAYLPIFGFFSVVTTYFFIRGIYEQGTYFFGSLFLFMMNGYFFSSMNSIRYYLVLAIAMYSMKYLLRKDYIAFVAWILLGAMFHKTLLIVIPMYLLALWLATVKLKKIHYIIGGIGTLSLIFGQGFYRKIMFTIYPFYENSVFDGVDYSITNIMKCVGTLVLVLLVYLWGNREELKYKIENRFYFILTLGGLILYTLGAFIPEVSRIVFYATITQIFFIPNLINSIQKKWIRFIAIIGVGSFFILHFMLFLSTASNTNIRLLPYLNWIFN